MTWSCFWFLVLFLSGTRNKILTLVNSIQNIQQLDDDVGLEVNILRCQADILGTNSNLKGKKVQHISLLLPFRADSKETKLCKWTSCGLWEWADLWRFTTCHLAQWVDLWRFTTCHLAQWADLWRFTICHLAQWVDLWRFTICHLAQWADLWRFTCHLVQWADLWRFASRSAEICNMSSRLAQWADLWRFAICHLG